MKKFLLLVTILFSVSCSENISEDQIINTRFMYSVNWDGNHTNLTIVSPLTSPVRIMDETSQDIIEIYEDNSINVREKPCEEGVLSGSLVLCANYFYNLDKNRAIYPENISDTMVGTMDAGGRILYSWDWESGVLTLDDTKLSPKATDDNSLVMWSYGSKNAKIISGNGKKLISEQSFPGDLKSVTHNGATIYFLYENSDFQKYIRACSSKQDECEDAHLPVNGTIRNIAVDESGICVMTIQDSDELKVFDFETGLFATFKADIIPDGIFFRWEEGKFQLIQKSTGKVIYFLPEI
ncbi:hypothetical protein KKD49_02490 [Myxococcota bacterium]|nr:hypothetical protein [Myxococcota bacterium]